MKTIFKALCAAALVGLSMLPAQAQEKTIEMGTMSWEDLTPITGITKKVLEDAGYTVNVTEFSEWGIAYAALAKGDIQILASQTDYVAQDYWNKNKNRLEKISPVSHGLFQGIAVPSYVTDRLDRPAERQRRQVRRQDHRHRAGRRPDARHRQCRQGVRPRARARRGQHGRHDRGAEVGGRPPGVDRGHALGAVVDDPEVRRQVPEGSEGRLPAAAELLLDRPEGLLGGESRRRAR